MGRTRGRNGIDPALAQRARRVLVFAKEDGVWTEAATLFAPDPQNFQGFGGSVSLSAEHALIGAFLDQETGLSAGAAYLYGRQVDGWLPLAKILNPDPHDLDRFGHAVATSDQHAIVGAYSFDAAGEDSGATFAFDVRSPSTHEFLLSQETAKGDGFGTAVAAEGNRLAVGAPGDNSVSVYRHNGNLATDGIKLTVEGTEGLGNAVALNSEQVLAGAQWDSDEALHSGAVFVADLGAEGLPSLIPIRPLDPQEHAHFGRAVGFFGAMVVVGAPDSEPGGALYGFEEIDGIWQEQNKIGHGGDSAQFGASLSASKDLVAVGAPLDDTAGTDAGAVYIFESVLSGWSAGQQILPLTPVANGQFGRALSLSGNRLLVGASNGPTGQGAAYLFERNGDDWQEVSLLEPSKERVGSAFGFSVDLEGEIAAISDYAHDTNGTNSGAVFLFGLHQDEWVPIAELVSGGEPGNQLLGYSVDLEGNLLVAGASQLDSVDLGNASGGAYLFRRVSNSPPIFASGFESGNLSDW